MFWNPVDHALSNLKKQVKAPLRVVLWDGREVALSESPNVTIRILDRKSAGALAKPSLLALAEAYIEGDAELEGDVREAIRSVEALTRSQTSSTYDGGPTNFRHTRRGDRDAIRHHYDVSNEFYALWLDPRMVYSCGYFRDESDSLEQAQLQKLDHICTKLRLQPGEKFLDIGCGWGALVMHAAQKYGVDATGITLSENQFRLATERIRAAGLQDRCRILLQDYRDHPGEDFYDKVASVGMFEHVGLRNLPTYFGVVQRLLRDRGLFLNHGITATDVENRPVGSGIGDFIGEYVFPHGELPHLHLAVREMAAANFEVVDVESLRPHYARTLAHWSRRLESRLDEAARLVSARTLRIWRAYLAGCSYGFQQGWVTIHQMLGSVQRGPGPSALPLTRDWMYR